MLKNWISNSRITAQTLAIYKTSPKTAADGPNG
jgi:hypothetical protein